jgi:hypothetical protein
MYPFILTCAVCRSFQLLGHHGLGDPKEQAFHLAVNEMNQYFCMV